MVDKRYFQGLPSPAAAALVVGFVWVSDDLALHLQQSIRALACVLTMFAGITMVTSISFYSFKDLNYRRSVPFWAALLMVLFMIVVSWNPPIVLFGVFVAYSISGYVIWAWNFRRARSPF